MASLRRVDRSPFWIACFSLPDGRRTNRSTGSTDKREAQRIADQFEDASKEAAAGRFIESRARKVIADIYALANKDALPASTVSKFFERWLALKELEAGPASHERYTGVVKQFLESLGSRAECDLANLMAKDVTKFRDTLAKRLSPGTVNLSVKIIRVALNGAKRDGLVDTNEAERVSLVKRKDTGDRRPFTLPELRRVLDVASEEWRGMILVGIYCGQRLGDIAGLTWNNVDLQRREIRFVTGKTGRRQLIPIAKPLVKHLESLPTSDDPAAPLFPKAHEQRERDGRTGGLSNQFYDILVAAGLAKARSHQKQPGGKGRSARRRQAELSFHALRHTATSLLKNAGVSDAVAREFIGHDSAAISANYTHIETSALRRAADLLPDVLATE